MADETTLSLKVTASTAQATKAIDKLEKSLEKLSATMNGFAQGKSGAGLTALSNSLDKISQANTKLNTRGLNSLLKTQNGLAQGSYNVARSTRSLSSAFDGLIPRIGKANRTTKGFVSSIGMFYAKFFLAIRAVRGLGNSIKSAMGMLETYNYFDNVIQTLSKKQVESMGDIGTDSAKAYYDSFYKEYSKQARDLTRKMTGYEIDERGMMRLGEATNLGLDTNMLMQYQSQFAQLATSMGNTADNGMKLSRALSEISADLASVKNMDFKDVMDNMSSGLVGMSRATDKFGINIRNTALQEKLYELGIDKSIAKMSQADKALLRTIVILDSSRYAWGDLSRTLDAPANQLRVLQASFASLSRTIGSMFLGVLQQILPYINAVVIALQRLAQYIIDFFGISIPNVTSQAGDMSNFADAIDEASDGLGTAASNAKKLKQNLLGIDELNVINDSGASSAGSPSASATPELQAALDAILDEYQKVWDEAYAQVENKAQKHAQAIIDAFKKGDWKGLGSYIADNLAKALEAIPWDKIKSGAGKFGKGLAEFMNGLFDPKLFEDIGVTWAEWLNTKFTFIGNFVKNFDWVNAGFSLASAVNGFVNTLDVVTIAHAISDGLKGALTLVSTFLKETDFHKIGVKIGTFIKEIDWIGVLSGIADVIFSAIFQLLNTFQGVFDASPAAGIIVTALASAIAGFKVIKIVEAFGKMFGLIEKDAAFASAATNVGLAFAGYFFAGVVGYQLGNKLAEYLYGEEWTLANNWGQVLDWASGKDAVDKMILDAETRSADVHSRWSKAQTSLDTLFKNEGVANLSNLVQGDPKVLDDFTVGMSRLKATLDATNESISNMTASDLLSFWDKNSFYLGDLDTTAQEALQTLIENYDELNSYDQMLIATAYGLEDYTDKQRNRILADHDASEQAKQYIQDNLNLKGIYDALPSSIQNNIDKVNNFITKYKDHDTAVSKACGWLDEITEKYEKAANMSENAQERSTNAINATQEAIKQYAIEQGGYVKALDDSVESSQQFVESLQEMGVSSDELSEYLDALKDEDIPGITEQAQNMVEVLNTDLPTSIQTFKDFATDVKKHLETVKSYWTDTFLPLFTEDALTQAFANLEPTVTTIFEGMAKAVVGIVNKMIDAINDAFDISWDAVEVNGEKVVEAGSAQLIKINRIEGFMNGGFPSGDIFMANEYGNAEMIGRIGNNTAVANNDQIVNAVSSGVRGAIADIMIPYLSQIASDTRECANKDLEVNIGDREIARANARGVSSMGRTIIQTI